MKENQIPPTYSSLNFLIFLSFLFSNIKKKIISLFSGTERHTKLKLGPHMDSRLMYHVYLNQAAGAYLFLYFLIFFLLNSKTLIFCHFFSVRPTKLKLDTHMGKGLIYCVHQIQVARIYLFLYFSSFFLSLQLAKIKNLLLQNCFNILLMAKMGVCELFSLLYLIICLKLDICLKFYAAPSPSPLLTLKSRSLT